MILQPFTKHYDGRCVLQFPGLTLEKGKIYAVIGANGSGKSTFARILAGVLKADQGGMHTDARTVGYMPQKNFAFRMSAEANVLLGKADKARAGRLMEALQISHLAKKRADRLSGGETARLALARLLMRDYELVILDEPTAAMDRESTILSEKLISEYVQESGCCLILVTHSISQARRLAHRALYFHRGLLTEQGDTESLLNDPQKEETRQFLEFYGV